MEERDIAITNLDRLQSDVGNPFLSSRCSSIGTHRSPQKPMFLASKRIPKSGLLEGRDLADDGHVLNHRVAEELGYGAGLQLQHRLDSAVGLVVESPQHGHLRQVATSTCAEFAKPKKIRE